MTARQCAAGTYVFTAERGNSRHDLLAATYDAFSTGRLTATGVAGGWQCLEIGAGGGSIARWLAGRVLPTGRVLATDLDVDAIPATEGLTVLRHDLTRDPLPANTFDLIYGRLVLRHLPRRDAVLRKLVGALKPGGLLQLEEFDTSYEHCLLASTADERRLYQKYVAAKNTAMAEAGVDVAYGRNLASSMHQAGLVDIDALPHIEQWHGGSPGLTLLAMHATSLRERLLPTGLTGQQLADVRELLDDPSFVAVSSVLYSVRGRRPR